MPGIVLSPLNGLTPLISLDWVFKGEKWKCWGRRKFLSKTRIDKVIKARAWGRRGWETTNSLV